MTHTGNMPCFMQGLQKNTLNKSGYRGQAPVSSRLGVSRDA
jgi:hypothetical protein